ncbi:hypothetical protein JOQ06_016935 [Pogonophryne albipinna]|uniref:Carboxylic ester hydrolase n=1 Tax=Pogonophryne albipinna TaxID=1090488 RepID=A0AAD6B385_9TELE|nr:hypothetical protein JOQ06_016935 [Pogonophryne albipinna]
MATIPPCTHLAFLLLLLPHFLAVSLANQDDLLIDTKQGKVQGTLLSVLGGDVRSFLGIPYGKPPVGKLRFRAPEPVDRWEGVKDASNFPNSCYQLRDTTFPGFEGAEMWNPNTPISEDCLYLNVWTPRFNTTQSKPSPLAPVLVWIYGGGFFSGTSSLDLYNGRFLTKSEGVVVVSMNYRLGPFGFLSIPDNKNIQSNVGLLDQRLALNWVANNIAAFGGDSSQVTLFGESAGAASVGLHLLSPGSQSLFHRAMMQSSTPNAPWATMSKEEARLRSMKLVTLLGCPTSPPADMEACMEKADPQQIALNQFNVLQTPFFSAPFAPYVDGDFLPDKVEVLLSTGNLPKKEVLIGLNKNEGTYFLMYGLPGFNLHGQSLITRNEFLKGVALVMANASTLAREAAIFHYTEWSDENNRTKNRDLLGRLVGDYLFISPLLEFARSYSKHGGKTFLYSFDHRSSVNPWPKWMGVMHGYEIEFIFGMPLNASLGYTKNEVNMTKNFMKHWANFARVGNPGLVGASWPVFTPEKQEYVTLNFNDPEQRNMISAKESYFWNELIPKVQAACLKGNGIILHCNYAFLLILLVLTLTY